MHADDRHRFELSGGALCLDFVNTWGDRESGEDEHPTAYPDLLAFAEQTGVVDDDDAARLAAAARRDPAAATAAYARGRELREAMYRLFSSCAAGREPAGGDLERLNAALPGALGGLRLTRRDGAFGWTRGDVADELAAPLRPVVRDAAELLTSPERLARVRECDGAGCTWLFVDASRNRSRRWCSMQSCGNRAKARRHYRRHQAEG